MAGITLQGRRELPAGLRRARAEGETLAGRQHRKLVERPAFYTKRTPAFRGSSPLLFSGRDRRGGSGKRPDGDGDSHRRAGR